MYVVLKAWRLGFRAVSEGDYCKHPRVMGGLLIGFGLFCGYQFMILASRCRMNLTASLMI
jgi:hypothetical protein